MDILILFWTCMHSYGQTFKQYDQMNNVQRKRKGGHTFPCLFLAKKFFLYEKGGTTTKKSIPSPRKINKLILGGELLDSLPLKVCEDRRLNGSSPNRSSWRKLLKVHLIRMDVA